MAAMRTESLERENQELKNMLRAQCGVGGAVTENVMRLQSLVSSQQTALSLMTPRCSPARSVTPLQQRRPVQRHPTNTNGRTSPSVLHSSVEPVSAPDFVEEDIISGAPLADVCMWLFDGL